jgi:homoserine dehydrogenase
MSRNKLTIGLFGFGCVGYGLYEVLHKTNGLKSTIKTICVKDKNKSRPIDASYFTYDKEQILSDPEINVVVELIDDADAAFDIVSQALKNGKAVVSANKKMIAEHFETLLELQRKHQVPLLYEAACCASIPIIRNLEEYYDNDLLESIEGIVNGSTNYILSKTFSENISYEQALKQAQEKGYAESNPILDTGGFDAKYKLLILIAHSFGLVLKPEDIFQVGIDRLIETELNYAREKDLKIKLVARAYKSSQGYVTCFVMPQFVSKNDPLYDVDDVYNGVITKTCFADKQFFVGKGAGAYPTASAVLSDISALSYQYKYEYKKYSVSEQQENEERIFLKVLLSYGVFLSQVCRNYFDLIEEVYQNQQAGYIIGVISLKRLKEALAHPQFKGSVVLFYPVENGQVFSETFVQDTLEEAVYVF